MLKTKKATLGAALQNEPVLWAAVLLSIMLKCIYYQFTTQLNTRPVISATNIFMLLSSLGILLIIFSAVFLLFNKKRLWALLFCDFLLTVLLLADTNFFRYYYHAITIPVFMQFDFNMLGSVDKSIMSLFKPIDVIYILDLPLLALWIVSISKKGIPGLSMLSRSIFFLLLLASGLTNFFMAYNSADIDAFVYSDNYVSKSLGVFYSHYDSTKNYIKENVFGSKELTDRQRTAIEKYLKQKHTDGTNYKGAAKGKNLIIIQIEAMQGFMVNRKVNGIEITPSLNKLTGSSLYFNDFYYQVAGGNTSDAEFLCNTSLYPAKEGAVYYRYPENTYYSMPKMLKGKGYNTYVLHAFEPTFWNRSAMYKAIGFDHFINKNDFTMDEFAGWDAEALSDSSFFRQSIEKIDTSKPFYSFFITLSSHHPFKYFEDYNFDVGSLQGTYMGDYVKAASYADKCLGQFINDLKKRGLYENSLLVIYGDHSGVPKYKSSELMNFTGTDFSEVEWEKLQKVPLIIHIPGMENGRLISTTGGEIDILPTVANIMGLEDPYALGKDLLNTADGYAVLRSGSIVTDRFYYNNEQRKVFDIKTGELLKQKDYKEKIMRMLEDLSISDLILEKDTFRNQVKH